MSLEDQPEPALEACLPPPSALPTPHIESPNEQRRTLSLVWLVPLFAASLALWLAYQHYQEQGPVIHLHFNSGESIEAGVTRIKYKDMEIGLVTEIGLDHDLSGVIISARMIKEAHPWLTNHTRFWVVRPQVGLGGVSGLSTLFSGAYIQADVLKTGTPTLNFVGLETPPLTEGNAPGLRLKLTAEKAGSVNLGSPVYFRQIAVGQVESRQFSEDYQQVEFSVFIRAPHHLQITKKTRFWNASGVEATLSSEGINLRTESFEALLVGGITFGNPPGEPPVPSPTTLRPLSEAEGGASDSAPFDSAQGAVATGAVFPLFDNEKAAREQIYSERVTCMLYFRESVRGLKPGAPVEYLGVPVGQVTRISLRYDEGIDKAYIPVQIELEPERIGAGGHEHKSLIEKAVLSGLRAQLQTGNLLTGQLFVTLKVLPDSAPPVLTAKEPYPEIPTVASELNQITDKANAILDKLNALPLEALLSSATQAIDSAKTLLSARETRALSGNLNQTLTQARGTLLQLTQLSVQLGESLTAAQKVMAGVTPQSPVYYEMTTTLQALQEAAQSIQGLVEALERNPKALILGE